MSSGSHWLHANLDIDLYETLAQALPAGPALTPLMTLKIQDCHSFCQHIELWFYRNVRIDSWRMTLVILLYLISNVGEVGRCKLYSHVHIFFRMVLDLKKIVLLSFDWSCFLNVYRYGYEQVIAGVMEFLSLQIPPFIRIDLLQTIFTQASSLGNFPEFVPVFFSFNCPFGILN